MLGEVRDWLTLRCRRFMYVIESLQSGGQKTFQLRDSFILHSYTAIVYLMAHNIYITVTHTTLTTSRLGESGNIILDIYLLHLYLLQAFFL